MIEDQKDESAPIVDTDYRFGFMMKFQYGLTETSWLGVRLTPWAHESTHVGDEYTIIASRVPGFERINPSFEYLEYGLSYERMFGEAMLTLRHGGIHLHGEDGYCSKTLLGSKEPRLTPSEKNFESSFGAEWRGWQKGTATCLCRSTAGTSWLTSFIACPAKRKPNTGPSVWRSASPCLKEQPIFH